MSLLTATPEDLKPGRGRPLPDRTWLATVQSAQVVKKENGTSLETVLTAFRDRDGSTEITLPDGSIYRPGNRKVFDRLWIDHSDTKTAIGNIGSGGIKKQANSAGLLSTNGDGPAALEFASWEDYASALVAQTVTLRTRQELRLDRTTKQPVVDEDGSPIIDVRVAEYLPTR